MRRAAEHAGICPGCGTRIQPGDPIVFDREADGWVHAGPCDLDVVPAAPLCDVCRIYHAGPC